MRNVQVLVTGVHRFDVWFWMLPCLDDLGDFRCEHTDHNHNQRSVVVRTPHTNQTLERVLNKNIPRTTPFAVQEMEECHECQKVA